MKAVRIALLLATLGALAFCFLDPNPDMAHARARQISAKRHSTRSATPGAHELDFPYYSPRDGSNSTLMLVNRSPDALPFVVAFRSLSGKTLLAPSRTIPPQEKLSIDVGGLVAQLGGNVIGDFGEGSAALYFVGRVRPLTGHISNSDPARRRSWEGERVPNAPQRRAASKELHGLWWGIGAGREAMIVVSNTAATPVTADVFLDFRGKRYASAPLTFEPHETKPLSVAGLLASLNLSPSQAPEGGISIIPRSPQPSLIAQGRITDPPGGFSSGLSFPDPAHQLASALHANGIPVGEPSPDSPYARMGTFVPHVIVRNLQATPQTVTITVEYAGEKGTEQVVLPPLTLAGYANQETTSESVMGELPLPLPFCSVRIQHGGPPGSVVAAVSSREARGNSAIDSPVANEGDGWAGSGAHAWHLDEGTESVLFLTNESEKECPIGVQVHANGVAYQVPALSLKPRETRAIDLRKLRDAQQADLQDHMIPVAATDGIVRWTRLAKLPVMGQMEVVQPAEAMASPDFEGGDPCPPCYAGSRMVPTQSTLIPTQTVDFNVSGLFQDCDGLPEPWALSSVDWISWYPAVATASNGSGTQGLVTGVSGGSTRIEADLIAQ